MAEKQDTETRRQTVEQLLKQVADKAIAEGHRVSFGEITRTDKGYETVMTLQERYFVKCGAKDHIYTMTIPLSDLSIPALRDVIKKPHSQARSLLPAFHADLAQNLCKGIYNGCNDILCRAEAQEQRRYELYGRPIKVGDHVLRRIRATQEFTSGRGNVIKPGQVGGYVENFDNLMGKAWVNGDAKVYGNAVVCGEAWVGTKATVNRAATITDKAWVEGRAVISDSATIKGYAFVSGHSFIYDNAIIKNRAAVVDNARIHGTAIVGDLVRVEGDAKISGNVRIGEKYTIGSGAEIRNETMLKSYLQKRDTQKKIKISKRVGRGLKLG